MNSPGIRILNRYVPTTTPSLNDNVQFHEDFSACGMAGESFLKRAKNWAPQTFTCYKNKAGGRGNDHRIYIEIRGGIHVEFGHLVNDSADRALSVSNEISARLREFEILTPRAESIRESA